MVSALSLVYYTKQRFETQFPKENALEERLAQCHFFLGTRKDALGEKTRGILKRPPGRMGRQSPSKTPPEAERPAPTHLWG